MSALERLCIRTPRAAVPLISLALLQAAHVQGQPFPDVEPGLRQVPADQPAPPGDSFVPPVDGSGPDPGAPVIGQWSPSAEHGQTVVLTGDRFTAPGSAADTEFFFFGQHTAGQPSLEPALIQYDPPRVPPEGPPSPRADCTSHCCWKASIANISIPPAIDA